MSHKGLFILFARSSSVYWRHPVHEVDFPAKILPKPIPYQILSNPILLSSSVRTH